MKLSILAITVFFQLSAFAGNCGNYCFESCEQGEKIQCNFLPSASPECHVVGNCTITSPVEKNSESVLDGSCGAGYHMVCGACPVPQSCSCSPIF